MRFSTIRNSMLSLVVLSLAGLGVEVGTFAQFNATTQNSGNTFSTATITFSDVLNAGGAGNTCTSTAGATAVGSGCTTALGTLATMVPGDSKFGTVVLNNGGTVPAAVSMAVADSANNILTNTAIGSAASSPTSAGLGLLIFGCTTSGGTDENCTATDTSGKVQLLYGSCAGAVTTVSTALPIASGTFSTAGLTDNGIKVAGTECYGGNTATALDSLNGASAIPLASSLATSMSLSLVALVYVPPSTNAAAYQNLSGNSLTYTWTATQLAGTSH